MTEPIRDVGAHHVAQTISRTRAPKPVRKPTKRPLPWPLNLWQTAIGKKWVMALTGIGLLGFVLSHMIGNLHLYEGAAETHEYAETLRSLGSPIIPHGVFLWILRLGLIGMFALHIAAAMGLTAMNAASNDGGYKSKQDFVAADFASRTMRLSGIVVALFLIWHLADLTWGWVNPDFVYGDPYHNVVESFSRWPMTILYIVANLALGLHIYHGAWSLFTSLGVNNPKINVVRRKFAIGLAALIVIGNLSFPIMVQTGVIDDDGVSYVEQLELTGDHDA